MTVERRAEQYSVEDIKKIELVGRANKFKDRLVRDVQRVEQGNKNFCPVIIKGLYGAGKTILIRRRRKFQISLSFFLGS